MTTQTTDLLDAIETAIGLSPDEILADPVFNVRTTACAHCGRTTVCADLIIDDDEAEPTCADCIPGFGPC